MAVDVSMWSSEAWSSAADLYLLALAREGSDEAFAELWRRNLPAAYAMADRYKGRGHAEDIVAEAATRVFSLIKEGRGPEENFRAYFLSAVRSVAVDSGRRTLQLVPTATDDLDSLLEPVLDDADRDDFDPALVRTAFAALSERDQRILWHTTVEGQAPRNVAPQLGMSPNGVSVRAMRAREALRVAYLEAYAAQRRPGARTAECQWAISVLGTEARGRLPKRASDRLRQHLEGCAHESAVLAELQAIQGRFPAVIVPLLFLAGTSTTGFLSAATLTAGGAAGSVAAAAAAGSAGSAGAAGSAGTAAPGVPAHAARAADLSANIAGRVTVVAAAVLVGLGVAGAGGPPISAASAPAVPRTTTTATPSATSPVVPATPDAISSSSGTPRAARPSPVTPSAVGVSPATSLRQVAPAASASSPPMMPTSQLAGPDITLRTIHSGTSTRFSVLFTTQTTGPLRIRVATPTGAGSLSVDNGPFTCTATSASSLTCTGRDGHLLLTLSPTGSSPSVVVSATDSLGGATTRTFRLG